MIESQLDNLDDEASPSLLFARHGPDVARGATLWGHSGYWGSFMFYDPESQATFTGTFNHTGSDRFPLIATALDILSGATPTTT